MKHNINRCLRDAVIIDSMLAFQNNGHHKPALSSLSAAYNIVNNARHSAVGDVCALKRICDINWNVVHNGRWLMTYEEISRRVSWKLPLHPNVIPSIAKHVDVSQLVRILTDFADDETDLPHRMVRKISTHYITVSRLKKYM